MKPKVCLFVFLGLVLIGCQQPVKTGELAIIDISKSFPKKEIHLQDIAEIEYVPLETSADVLLVGNGLFYVSDQFILVMNQRQGDIFVFGRNGKIISHFNHQGQGDKEYRLISSITFDEKNGEIFVFDMQNAYRILVYSVGGEYKRTLKYAENLGIAGYNFDDETLLVYDDYGLRQNEYSKKPYMFMSKKDGSIVSELDITLPVRYSQRSYFTREINGQMMTASIVIYSPNNRFFGQDFVIADISSDTIYQLLKTKELTPLVVRTPSVHASEPRTILVPQLTTNKFILVEKLTLDFIAVQNNPTRQMPSINWIYEFETGETSDVAFVNDDYLSGKNWGPTDVSIPTKNVAVSLIETPGLVEAYKEKKLKGELEQLTATLDEEDNPVLMIVKFK